MRTFATGATRDTDDGKVDYEGCLSPAVLECFAQYMLRHSTQRDGKQRTMDNWQRGIPLDVYMKSLLRHTFTAWALHRYGGTMSEMKEALCAIQFNQQGYLHTLLTSHEPASMVAAHGAHSEPTP